MRVRPLVPADLPVLLDLLDALADYERLPRPGKKPTLDRSVERKPGAKLVPKNFVQSVACQRLTKAGRKTQKARPNEQHSHSKAEI